MLEERPRSHGRGLPIAVAVITLVASIAASWSITQPAAAATTATLTVDAATVTGTVNTTLSTQIVWPTIPGTPNAQTRLNTLAPQMVRIHAGTDGGFGNVVLPFNVAGKVLEGGGTKQPWDFAVMDSMVNSVRAAGTVPVMNVRYAPDPMYTCTGNFGDPGTLIDQTYGVFSDYMANLVRYYNVGSFAMPQGGTKTNPAGTANRITWWEIWNEPDYPWENPCTGDGTHPILNPSQYVALWNATATKMKAVDPTIKLVGPAPSNHPSLEAGNYPVDYVPLLLSTATIKPDAVSFHGYGGWDNTQGDRLLFDGSGGGGIKADVDGLANIKSLVAQYAPGTPVWLTETNVSADPGLDPAQRAWNQFSAAWGASLFRAMVVGGLSMIHQFQFLESKQLGLIDPTAGTPLLPYWRDYYLSRYFPVGSPILLSTPSAGAPEVEMLAARQPGGSNVRVLVIDRQVGTTKAIGLPVTVTLNLQNMAGLQSVTMRMLDATTLATLATGPALVTMPASSTQTIAFTGYGAALLEFSSSSPPPSGAPTPTPTPTATPAPIVSSVAPNGGSIAGGTSVTLQGANFQAGATVSFGGSALSVGTITATTITGTTTAHSAGAVTVTVTNPGGQSGSCSGCFTYSSATASPSPSPSPSPSASGSASPTPSSSGSATPAPSGAPTPTPIPIPSGAPTTTMFMPNLTKTLGGPDGWDTPFIVQNVGADPADVLLSFYRFSDGALISEQFVPALAPGTSYADVPVNDGELPSDTQFSLVVRSYGSRVVTVVNQAQGKGDRMQAASYVGTSSGATTVYLPNVTRRFYGYDTPFIVQNLGSATTLVTASFTSFDGLQHRSVVLVVQPGRSGVVDPDYTAGLVDGTQYSVVLHADQPIAAIVNAHNETGAPVAYTTGGVTTGGRVLFAPYAAKSDSDAGLSSPIVVQNLSDSPLDALLEFTQLGGGSQQTFTLSGIGVGGSKVFDPRFTLGTTSPCHGASATCLGAGEYSVRIVATGTAAAIVIPTSSVTADAYAASAAPATRAFLPNVTRTLGGPDGWTTPIVLQAGTGVSTTATLRWYRFTNGALARTQVLTVPAGGALWIDPRTVTGLQDDAQYSVVVDGSAGATITAIVYEHFFGGGDGVMIYSGLPE